MINNTIKLIGRITQKPNRPSDNENAPVLLRLATDRRYKKDDERVEETDFHLLTAFGQPGRFALEYLEVGQLVAVEANLRQSSYENDGETHFQTKIMVEQIQSLGKRVESKQEEPR